MRDDLKAAFRSLRSSKTFTAVALLVLALGIGASTAIFSVVDAVVLRGLPFDEHDRLVAVGERRTPSGRLSAAGQAADPLAISSAAPQNYVDWAAQQQVFGAMAAIAGGAFTLREPGAEPEDLRSQRVTAGFFDVLRVRPAMGRPFTAEHEVDGRHQVAILSDGLWRRRFGADPQIVGRTIPLEGGSYEVLGVMPPEFEYPIGVPRPTELWVPYVVPENERIRNPRSFSIYLQTIARLKAGVTLAQAQAEMDRIAANLTAAHPEWNKDTLFGVRPLRDHLVGARTKDWMLMLLGAVAIVLLIACANVANLLLARASAREREVGIRAAMGAGR
jgi:putative ABC transport system permease protein